MTWVSLVLALLQGASALIGWLRERGQLSAGEDAAIARATVSILAESDAAKAIMAEVMGLSDAQVDDALKKLEP